MGGGGGAAGQQELAQRRQRGVELRDGVLDFLDVGVRELCGARYGDLGAEVEQPVLCLREDGADQRSAGVREHDPDGAVELVDVAERVDAGVGLGHARAVRQAGRALVAGAGRDAVQSVGHGPIVRKPRGLTPFTPNRGLTPLDQIEGQTPCG